MKVVNTLVQESSALVETIRSGPLARNDAAKRELEEKLKTLEEGLQHAGSLAWVAAAYSQTNEKVLDLLQLCKRAELFLRDNMDDLADDARDGYRPGWLVLSAIFDGIAENRDVPRSVMLDRAEWYDADDRAKIELRLHDFTIAHERAVNAVRIKVARDARRELQAMIEPLEDVEALLQDTIYQKVLRTLQLLAR